MKGFVYGTLECIFNELQAGGVTPLQTHAAPFGEQMEWLSRKVQRCFVWCPVGKRRPMPSQWLSVRYKATILGLPTCQIPCRSEERTR